MTKIMNGHAARLESAAKTNRFNLKYFNLGLYAVIGVVGVFYLINISNLTVLGFSLRDLRSQVTTLASINLDSQETVNSAQSYYSLSTRTKNLNMVAVGDVEYLSMNGKVAMAK